MATTKKLLEVHLGNRDGQRSVSRDSVRPAPAAMRGPRRKESAGAGRSQRSLQSRWAKTRPKPGESSKE